MTQFPDAAEDVRDHADPAANQCAYGTVGQRRNRIWALHINGCRGSSDQQTTTKATEQTSPQILPVQQYRCPVVADLRSRDDGQYAPVGSCGIGGRGHGHGTSASGSSQERGQLIFIGGSGCSSGSGGGGGRSGSGGGSPGGGGSGNLERKQQPIDVRRSAGLLRDTGLNLDYLQFAVG